MAGRYRLYIDESGDGTVINVQNEDYRYLGLTGVILDLEQHERVIAPTLESLKGHHFPAHSPERPVVLVRQRIKDRDGPFAVLEDDAKNQDWEFTCFGFLALYGADLITIVIDKQATQERWGDADEDPYLRAMKFMLERYRGWLVYAAQSNGDVMIEAVNPVADARLKTVYTNLFDHGTGWVTAAQLQEVLTSRELKIRKKSANIAGLQIADLLANGERRSILADYGRTKAARPETFTRRVSEQMRGSYHPANRVLFPHKK